MSNRPQDRFDGPDKDDLHDDKGNHFKKPPPWARADWDRRMRQHKERDGLDDWVRDMFPALFVPQFPDVPGPREPQE